MKYLFFCIVMFSGFTTLKAQKGIKFAFQFNTQGSAFKDNTMTATDRAVGVGLGARIKRKVSNIPVLIEPRFMYHKSRVLSTSSVTDFKTSYIQLPLSVDLLSFIKMFRQLNANSPFHISLFSGLYVGAAIGGSFNNGTVRKISYGSGPADNRMPLNMGLQSQLSFGPNGSSFEGYIEVQRGFNNVIPTARITNGGTRKLNNVNVGIAFKIR